MGLYNEDTEVSEASLAVYIKVVGPELAGAPRLSGASLIL
jgi:hypothetical protein